MNRLVGCVVALLAVSLAGQTNTNVDRDNATVVRVVVEQLFAHKARAEPVGPLRFIVDETMSLEPTGRMPDRWVAALAPDPATRWPGLVEDAARRRQLIASFEARNATRRPLPSLAPPPGFTVAEHQRLSEIQRPVSGRAVAIVRVSSAGYSNDGLAMVVTSYNCGNLCGESWLVILDHASGEWRVSKTHPLSIS